MFPKTVLLPKTLVFPISPPDFSYTATYFAYIAGRSLNIRNYIMISEIYKSQTDKILSTIEKKGGRAKLSDLTASSTKFNQKGGPARLRELLDDMVSKGTLLIDKSTAKNGRQVASYSLANGNNRGNDWSKRRLRKIFKCAGLDAGLVKGEFTVIPSSAV